jgi:hypothetical protein
VLKETASRDALTKPELLLDLFQSDAIHSLYRSSLCVVGAPFLSVAKGRKVYWEMTILEAQGSVRFGFAGSKSNYGKPARHVGQGKKSWGFSSDNGNGYHRCDLRMSDFSLVAILTNAK